jgi:hypothetical protein
MPTASSSTSRNNPCWCVAEYFLYIVASVYGSDVVSGGQKQIPPVITMLDHNRRRGKHGGLLDPSRTGVFP